MFRKKIIALLTALIISLSCTEAFAFTEVERTEEGKNFDIQGTAAEANANVTLILTDKGVTLEECQNDPTKILYIKQVKSDSSAKFSIPVLMDVAEDTPVQAYLNVKGAKEIYEGLSFTVKNEEIIPEEDELSVRRVGTRLYVSGYSARKLKNKTITVTVTASDARLNNIKKIDIAAFRQVQTGPDGEYAITFDLNTNLYSTGTYDVRVREKGYDIQQAQVQLYGQEAIDKALGEINGAEDIKIAIENNKDVLCDDFDRFVPYLDDICQQLTGKPYSDINVLMDEVEKLYSEGSAQNEAISAINDASRTGNWALIEKYVTETYKDVFDISTGKLSEINNTKKLFLRMTGKTYASVSDVISAFDSAYDITLKEEKANKNKGNASSSGISSVGIAKPEQEAPKPEEQSKGFSDMSSAEWARAAVEYFSDMGYVSGYEDNTIRPNNSITREEFLTILIKVFGYDVINDGEGFSDTPADAWYFPYVVSGKFYGITAGKPDGSFGVGESIARADMAVMAYRAYTEKVGHLPAVNPAQVFEDFYSIPEYAVDAVTAMQQAGAINGKGGNMFCPTDFATRAEAIQMLYGMIDKTEVEKVVNGLLTTQEAGLLVALDMFKDDYKVESLFTRKDMARVVAAMHPGSIGTEMKFNDVSKDDEYYDYITVACGLGYMTDNDGNFYPNNVVTAEEFVPFLTAISGYGSVADHNGGGFDEHYKLFKEMDIPRVVLNADDKMDFNKAMYCIYRTLMANPMVWTGNTYDMSIAKDVNTTMLKKIFDLEQSKGIVEGIYKTTLTHADNSIGKNQVVINGTDYYYEGGSDFFGYYVEYFHNEDDEITYMSLSENHNSVRVIDSKDLISYQDRKLRYTANGETVKTITFDERPDFIYNSVAYPTYEDDEVIPQSGRIELIDNDKDGDYEIIKAYEYEYIVVGEMDLANKIAYDKFDSDKYLRLDENMVDVSVMKKGKAFSPTKIVEGNLLAYTKSKGSDEIIYVDVSGDCTTGNITGYDDFETVEIDGKSYDIDGRLQKMLVDGKFSFNHKSYIFVWLYDGRAVMAEYKSDAGANVAFLMKAIETDEDEVLVTVYTATKQKKRYYLSDRVIIDGVKCEDVNKVMAALEQGFQTVGVTSVSSNVAQPICYQLNSEDKIIAIDTAYIGEREDETSLLMDTRHNSEKWRYSLPNKTFYTEADNKIVTTVKPSTTAFWVPQNDVTSEVYYNVTPSGNMLADNAKYTIRAFGESENFTSDYLFIFSNVSSAVPQSAAAVPLKKHRVEFDEDGELVNYVDVYVDGQLKSLKVESGVSVPNIDEGDLIRYRTNPRTGDIMVLSKTFDVADVPDASNRVIGENSTISENTDTYDYIYRLIYGTLWAKDSNIITVTTGIADEAGVEAGEYIDNFYLGSETVYIYDSMNKGNKLRVGSMYDLLSYKTSGNRASRVLIYTTKGTLKMIYAIVDEG